MSRRGSTGPGPASVPSPSATPLWVAIVGQPGPVALLQRAAAEGRIAHAYAFVGPAGVGRRLTARALAQALLCPAGGCGPCPSCRRVTAGVHPDLQVLAPSPPRDNPRGTPALRIEEVRAVEHAAALAPLESRWKVFILDDADRLTPPAAHALLKTLEEPPPRTVLVLVLQNPRSLPPTVLSRCQRVRFRLLDEEATARVLAAQGAAEGVSRELARLCPGQPGLARGLDVARLLEDRAGALALARLPWPRVAAALDAAGLDRDRARVAGYLETYWLWCRDALCLAAGVEDLAALRGDDVDELRSRAAHVPVAAWLRALDAVKAAWLALEANAGPRLCLERALVAMGAVAS